MQTKIMISPTNYCELLNDLIKKPTGLQMPIVNKHT